MISETTLREKYIDEKKSMNTIGKELNCSQNTVVYWMKYYKIERRSRSEARYVKANPKGDPFSPRKIDNIDDSFLAGLGMGLYWGEGTKASKYSVRLGNSDPKLLLAFMTFLETIYGVSRSDFKFGLQLFTDIDQELALQYWSGSLSVKESQFYKVHVTISGSLGTYRTKSKFGVATVYYNNKKLRDILVDNLPR